MKTRGPTQLSASWPDAGPLLRVLPYVDGAAAYAAYNLSFASADISNLTVACTAIGTFQCPSDPSVTSPVDLASRIGNTSTTYASKFGYYSALPPGTWSLRLTSYAAASGAYPLGQSMAGIYPAFAPTPAIAIVQVTDGLSNTLAFAENTTAWLPRDFCDANGL